MTVELFFVAVLLPETETKFLTWKKVILSVAPVTLSVLSPITLGYYGPPLAVYVRFACNLSTVFTLWSEHVRRRAALGVWSGALVVGLISQQRASDIAEIQTPGIWPSHAHAHQAKEN